MIKANNPFFLSVLVFSLVVGGCATLPTREEVTAQKRIYLKEVCAQNKVYWQWDNVAQVATLVYKDVKAEVLVGSDLVLIGKDRVTLDSPVLMVRSAVVVPPDFSWRVIGRMRQETVQRPEYGVVKIREIMIDAGHGGKDPGATGHLGVQEKGVVLDISKRLADILQSRGMRVRMTRETDEFISLQKRTEIASLSGVDLFVSIHANASPARGAQGVEVFAAAPLGAQENNEEQRKTNERLMLRNLSMIRDDAHVERIVSDMLYSHKQTESRTLAARLAETTAGQVKTKNRGDKTARFYVLQNTLVPAVLVEVGFLTNPKEAKLLDTNDYRQRVAHGIAEGILEYANGK